MTLPARYTLVTFLLIGFIVQACSSSTRTVSGAEPKSEGISLRQICNSEHIFLAHYALEKQYGTPLPPECCAPGILPEESMWLCTHDWPFGDVPPCSYWGELSEELKHLVDVSPKWLTQAHKNQLNTNLKVVQKWKAEQYGCIPSSP